MRRSFFGTLALIAALASDAHAMQVRQSNPGQDPLSRAMNAERRGVDAEASALYRSVLGQEPGNIQALLGAERTMQNLGRSAEFLPILQQAVRVDSTSIGVLSLAVRSFARAGFADSARRYATRWATVAPNIGDDPWREWSQAAIEGRDLRSAKLALQEGRRRLGDGVLAPDLAQLLQLEGDFAGATRLWLEVLANSPTYRNGALILLGQAPIAQRAVVHAELLRDGSVEARRLLALLQVRWGEAEAGFAQLRPLLPADRAQAIAMLESLVDELRGRTDPEAQRVRGSALEAVAARQNGATVAKTRLEAAQAYADGGSEREARRLLSLVAADTNAPPNAATGASTTLLGVLIAEGKGAEAEEVLDRLTPSLSLDQRDHERRRIAMAWARRGDFDRADALVVSDSSVAGFDLRGRLRLYRGDLAGATELLQEAGPFDDDREHAVTRVTLLALLQAVEQASAPELGTALLALERADSATALQSLRTLAESLPPAGAAEARLLAGRVAAAQGDTASARILFAAADTSVAPATAPSARFALATLYATRGEVRTATELLEALLLDFSSSAVAPEARRLRESLRRTSIPEGR